MADEDKYPLESDRRRFVKGVVGAGALSGLAATGAAAINMATAPSGGGGGLRQYYGIERTDGPAPRGMPQIPVEIDDEGFLRGFFPEPEERQEEGQTFLVAEAEIAGITYSNEWFHYCGGQTFPGLAPGADQDNYFYYSDATQYQWQNEEVSGGDRVHIDHFEDYQEWGNEVGEDGVGKGANARWRSEGMSPANTLPVQIIRSERYEEMAQEHEWLAETTEEGFLAYANKCTHFCCVPGYKVTEESERFNAGDGVYCQCHQSVYDPFNILQQQFVALPRDDDDEGGGGGGGGGGDDGPGEEGEDGEGENGENGGSEGENGDGEGENGGEEEGGEGENGGEGGGGENGGEDGDEEDEE